MDCQSRKALWILFAALAAMLSAKVADGGRPEPVPPTLEIVVLDPNADPLGNPAVEIQPSADNPGMMEVDIPPAVIVHRFYYTGDRCFQGPMLPGGPSIVVCHHPKTGEKCYVPVQMLPGAPVVRYSAKGIEYDYGKNGITLDFCTCKGHPKVVYRNCRPPARVAKNVAAGVARGTVRLVDESRVPEATLVVADGVKNVSCATRDAVTTVGTRLLAPFIQLIASTPLGTVLNKPPGEVAQHYRDRQVREAARKARRDDVTIPTLR